jgi:hypothetical protein
MYLLAVARAAHGHGSRLASLGVVTRRNTDRPETQAAAVVGNKLWGAECESTH